MTVIYGLRDPRDGRVRYVGKSIRFGNRFEQHLAGRSGAAGVGSWVRDLRNLALEPDAFVIEKVDDVRADEREGFWISEYAKTETGLLNVSKRAVVRVKRARREFLPPQPPSESAKVIRALLVKKTIVRYSTKYATRAICAALKISEAELMRRVVDDIPIDEEVLKCFRSALPGFVVTMLRKFESLSDEEADYIGKQLESGEPYYIRIADTFCGEQRINDFLTLKPAVGFRAS